MRTTVDSLPNAAAERSFERAWAIITTGLDADARIPLKAFEIVGRALFAAGLLEGGTQVRAFYRGESNQEPPNDEAS